MKNFNIGHRANFSDKLIINLYLLFPVRAISRGFVTSGEASDVTADRTRASCEILANSDFIYLFYGCMCSTFHDINDSNRANRGIYRLKAY